MNREIKIDSKIYNSTGLNHMKELSRRQFFKKTSEVGAGLTLSQIIKYGAATGIVLEAVMNLTGCAHLGFEPEPNVVYPQLKGKKIQPPEFGCYFGMHHDEPGIHMTWADTVCEQNIGRIPMIIIPPFELMRESRIWGRFNRLKTVEDLMPNEGTIPFYK